MSFKSFAVTLEQITNAMPADPNGASNVLTRNRCFFQIPIYQRLYVWGKDQIKTLLEDLLSAFLEKKEIFYLGGVLIVSQEIDQNSHMGQIKDYKLFDLIDGQQRFTTLWLISLIFGEALSPFLFEKMDKVPHHRMRFPIREEVKTYFEKLLDGVHAIREDINILPPAPDEAKKIESALADIHSFKLDTMKKLADSNHSLYDFTQFIYQNVEMVATVVPQGTDLNKLFEVINNRGVQLQHYDILKSRLLSILQKDSEDFRPYGLLWDICSDMGQFVEKSLRGIHKLDVAGMYGKDDENGSMEELATAKVVLGKLSPKDNDEQNRVNLFDIIAKDSSNEKSNDTASDDEDRQGDAVPIRSIISFPMLLQHTLRVWLRLNGKSDIKKVLEKELLGIFEESFFKAEEKPDIDDVKSFIELLYEIRYLFDKYIIKWVKSGEDEYHSILSIRKTKSRNNYYLIREISEQRFKELTLLQSSLYHSQEITTHYWLSPLLHFLYTKRDSINFDSVLTYLQFLDNALFCSEDEEQLIHRTWKYLSDNPPRRTLSTKILNDKLGVSFPHYWFYKLEYILWVKRSDVFERFSGRISENRKDVWETFTMRARNSVEHISPQNPWVDDGNKVSGKNDGNVLNSFGNLALVSRSLNSEFSNKPYSEKKESFRNKNVNAVDSLKMDLIYLNETWGDDEAMKHQGEMIELFENYLIETTDFPKL
jgi:hypothetical protein